VECWGRIHRTVCLESALAMKKERRETNWPSVEFRKHRRINLSIRSLLRLHSRVGEHVDLQ